MALEDMDSSRQSMAALKKAASLGNRAAQDYLTQLTSRTKR
jgi:hypothetical protein